jgi:hypothetical protein
MIFKGKITLFAVKDYWHKKLPRQKTSCIKIRWRSSLNQASKGLVSQ